MNDLKLWKLRTKNRGGITVCKFGKFDVDQSLRRGSNDVTRCLVTCGSIILVKRNIIYLYYFLGDLA